MYHENFAVFDLYLANLEEILRTTSTHNKKPLPSMIARYSRIYAFQKCASVLNHLLQFIYKECNEGNGPEDITVVLNDITQFSKLL